MVDRARIAASGMLTISRSPPLSVKERFSRMQASTSSMSLPKTSVSQSDWMQNSCLERRAR